MDAEIVQQDGPMWEVRGNTALLWFVLPRAPKTQDMTACATYLAVRAAFVYSRPRQ